MKKTATILALAGLSMASNPEHIHGSFRTRKIDSSVTLKPATLLADDEFQIIRDGGSSYNGDPRFAPKGNTEKPKTWTPPTNPKVWTPSREDVRLYADDADDELQIIRMDGPSYNGDPRFAPKSNTEKPKTWTPPTNPKVWIPQREDVRLYADDADDELQIIRMDGPSYNGDPRFAPKSNTEKPKTWTPPTNPKVWYPQREDVRLYADDADDELQILRPDRPSYNGDPRFAPKGNTKKPSTWTPPTNPKYWTPKREDFRLYADDADDELQILRMDGPSVYNGDPRFGPKPYATKPSTWTPPTNPKIWTPPREDVRLYADDADDELQIIRMDGPSYNGDPRFAPKSNTEKPKTWTPPTNPKVWYPTREDVRLYADDADDELLALGELLNL